MNSIRCQTYTNLEIILVDDGSPDNSGAICDEYAKMDNRIKVIHKKNGGLSDARNVGIEAATGAYLGFVDGDDYIEPEMYQKLYSALVENDAEISICRFRYVGSKEERNELLEINDEVLSGQDILLKKNACKNTLGAGATRGTSYIKEKCSKRCAIPSEKRTRTIMFCIRCFGIRKGWPAYLMSAITIFKEAPASRTHTG